MSRRSEASVASVAPILLDPHERVRVYCTQFASCRWAGYRQKALADEKPCPRCGNKVAH